MPEKSDWIPPADQPAQPPPPSQPIHIPDWALKPAAIVAFVAILIICSIRNWPEPAPPPDGIPNMKADDVYADLVARGFSLEPHPGGTDMGAGFKTPPSWTCTAREPGLELIARTEGQPDNVLSVQGTVMAMDGRPHDPEARIFFRHLVTLTCQRSKDAAMEARQWVQENVGKEAETTIEGVKLELFSSKFSRILTIKPQAAKPD